MTVRSFNRLRHDVDPGEARSRLSQGSEGLTYLRLLLVGRTRCWRTTAGWSDEPHALPQLTGCPLGVGGKASRTGQPVRGDRGHGARQGLNALPGAGTDGDH